MGGNLGVHLIKKVYTIECNQGTAKKPKWETFTLRYSLVEAKISQSYYRTYRNKQDVRIVKFVRT